MFALILKRCTVLTSRCKKLRSCQTAKELSVIDNFDPDFVTYQRGEVEQS